MMNNEFGRLIYRNYNEIMVILHKAGSSNKLLTISDS